MFSKRKAGVLLHISSLPNDHPIGSIGKEAFDFIDFLSASGMTYWQFLPLNDVYSDPSPYASISAMGNNVYLISIDKLITYGLLDSEPTVLNDIDKEWIDYTTLFAYKKSILKKAYAKFIKTTTTTLYSEFLDFCAKNSKWLDDIALFIAIKEECIYKRKFDKKNNIFDEYNIFKDKYSDRLTEKQIEDYYYGGCLLSWPDELKYRNEEALMKYSMLHSDKIGLSKFVQFIFMKQWEELHDYAKQKNIKLIGDIPIFVNYDSVDVWVNPKLFCLDEDLLPTKVAGVPPDYFSETGQLWGNPLYNWEEHKNTNYSWWKDRFKCLFSLVDAIRIDHFKAFSSYWAIPASEETAINGREEKGPGSEFFKSVFNSQTLPIIAEDLGLITEDVTNLRREFKLPGMFVSHFHLLNYNSREDLDRNVEFNNILYTGTHDNQTTKSWLEELDEDSINKICHISSIKRENLNVDTFTAFCATLPFNTFIVPLQDLLNLDDKARMNTPGTIENNWKWRFKASDLTEDLKQKTYQMVKDSNRM